MKRLLNVAFFVSEDKQSGTYFRYHNFAQGLAQLGHRVTVYSQARTNRRSRQDESRDGVKYVLPPSFPGDNYIDSALNPGNLVRRFVADWQERHEFAAYDVLHLFQPLTGSALQWIWRRKLTSRRRASRLQLFAWDWDDLWSGGIIRSEAARLVRDRLHLWSTDHMERILPSRADLVTTCSSYLAELAQQRGAHRTAVVHNGFWPKEYESNLPVNREAIRREYRLSDHAYYLGFAGWTPSEIEWCFDLLGRLCRENRNEQMQYRLAVCGIDVRPYLERQPAEVRAAVDYLGCVPSEKIHALMNSLDVGLLPAEPNAFNKSRFPIKFAHYLASGLPVMCSDVGEVGILGRELAGVVLFPAERLGWVNGAAEAIRRLTANRGAGLPVPTQLTAKLSWMALSEQLQSSYIQSLESRLEQRC